ncbi:MAG TPA: hypothetical protein VLC30_11670 [Pseudomonas sp.]|nr:hypothetical protein [Pseudomonas sp.]
MNRAEQHDNPPVIVQFKPQQRVGGAIIDAQGREVPITEQMIQQACRALESSRQAHRQPA